MRRRQFLGLVGSVVGLAATAGCGSGNGGSRTPQRTWQPTNRLRIPPQLAPPPRDVREYTLTLRAGRTEFLDGRATTSWGVNGPYLGPTLRVSTGDRVRMVVRNELPEATTLHWHGMRLPATCDGGPHQMIRSGATWHPEWTIVNAASTAWYHPHPHGSTATHVFRGVAGLIIIDDDVTEALPLPNRYGVDDIPCVIQDRSIDADGQSQWEVEPNFGQMGTDICVNGTMNAYVEISTTRVRLRVLNASSARLYHLGFTDARPFALVTNDAGLLPAPVETTRISLGPAERAEIVVTMTPGQNAVLNSVAGDERIDAGTFPVLELRAGTDLTTSPPVPKHLGGAESIAAGSATTVRQLKLQGHDEINGRGMDLTRIDQVVPAGALEVWELENNVYSHNFHIHGVEFTILDKDGQPPAAYETGRKDTVHVREHSKVRLAVRFAHFTDPVSPYMYHCHILRHEDDGMMGQFVVVAPGTEGSTPRSLSHAMPSIHPTH